MIHDLIWMKEHKLANPANLKIYEYIWESPLWPFLLPVVLIDKKASNFLQKKWTWRPHYYCIAPWWWNECPYFQLIWATFSKQKWPLFLNLSLFFSVPKAALTTIFGAFSPIIFYGIPKVAKEKPSQRPLTESSPYFFLFIFFFANFTRVFALFLFSPINFKKQ